ncbi:methyltransferase domain-containing protein [Schaalia sp. 19OD2882]|uniref:methyltransferase domain-containing protein n=1 Tax=Schaalia sp. 19OD2882 TaxID=2794089 RepID=UPI001C1EA953|nr:methyltransferase domain-containing protein [Schaalia sp. 19OD2882]QWW20751.1 methyltransferase domain-containing protein [Schaalia sp. 19OD2882]
MHCEHWQAGRCHSCSWLPHPYPRQVDDKQHSARTALVDAAVAGAEALDWLPPVTSTTTGFRTKVKLVIGGTPRRPTFGTLDEHRHGVDLPGCPIQHPAVNAAVPGLKRFVRRLRLRPYDVPTRQGELKYVHVSVGQGDALMLRFVLRTREHVGAIRSALPDLRALVPGALVVTANIHPRHEATVEGPDEIVLTRERTLPTHVGGVRLHLGPRAFAQTNSTVAGHLYRQVAEWACGSRVPGSGTGYEGAAAPADEGGARTLWDLYCGVGGFALHAAAAGIAHVSGVEISSDAIASARMSAREMGLGRQRSDFQVGDATKWALERSAAEVPDVVVVNPPRRGIGTELAAWLDRCDAGRVIYSSCNPASLAKDLASMGNLRPVQARLFDMFPHTAHSEVAVLLERR